MSFQRQVQLVLLTLLVAIEGLTFLAILTETRSNIIRQGERQLESASRVFANAMNSRRAELTTGVRVLAADFGFKRAVATSDETTLLSALSNHGARISSDLAFFIDRTGNVKASTVAIDDDEAGLATMIKLLRQSGNSVGRNAFGNVLSLDGSITQLVVAPVLAPDLIGWVAIGFLIDDEFAGSIEALTSLSVTFVRKQTGQIDVVASTLAIDDRQVLEARTSVPFDMHSATSTNLASSDFLGISMAVTGAASEDMQVVLALSLNDILQAYGPIRNRLLLILLLALMFSWIGSNLLASRVSRPLRELSNAAQRIRKGFYDEDVMALGNSDVEQLSSAFNDMQRGIRDREEQILYQAQHDALTDLPNRVLITDRLEHAIRRAKRHRREFSLVTFDLNGFKGVNDTLGHTIGDKVLQAVGQKLIGLARESDTVARIGGDEFLMLLEESPLKSAIETTQRFIAEVERPLRVEETQVRVDVCAGIVSYPAHGDSAETLMRRADIALYAAKEADLTKFSVYEVGRDEEHLRKLELINELRVALENDGLTVFYQPKVDLQSNRVCSVEALVRWHHNEFGMIPPDEFIPLAEQSGHIRDLTVYVLETVMKQLREWRHIDLQIKASINLSAHDLVDKQLTDTIAAMLHKYGVQPHELILEVTESAVMKDAVRACALMKRIRDQGIRLSIDDFGTGHSSLAQLKQLPLDELKIDKSFILELANSDSDKVIVQSTIEIAHSMGLSVTAEGVENEESRQLLQNYGCDIMQGYFVSKPLNESDFRKWIAKQQPMSAELDDEEICFRGGASAAATS